MRGHVSKKSGRYYPVLEHGYQQALRCDACDKRAGWVGQQDVPKVCPRCGSENLRERPERRQRWLSGHDRKKDAAAALVAALGEVSRGVYVEPSKITLAQFATDEWLPGIRATVRHSTWTSYRTNLTRHVLPELGNIELRALSASHLNNLYASLLESGRVDGGGGLSPTTTNLIHIVCHRLLRDAVKWGRLARNPADFCDPPRAASPEMRVWGASQLKAFLAHVRGDRLEGLWILAATTGARRGELAGLRWCDLDLDRARISIRQCLAVTHGRPYFSEPKTSKSRRSISLDLGTVGALRAHRRRQLEEKLAAGPVWIDSGLCFVRENGEPLHPERQVSQAFNRHVRDAGLPALSFHSLRHSYASIALSAGAHPKIISSRLGHSSIGVTLNTYSHLLEGVGEDEAARVAGLILG